jgi:hypothetical protein
MLIVMAPCGSKSQSFQHCSLINIFTFFQREEDTFRLSERAPCQWLLPRRLALAAERVGKVGDVLDVVHL